MLNTDKLINNIIKKTSSKTSSKTFLNPSLKTVIKPLNVKQQGYKSQRGAPLSMQKKWKSFSRKQKNYLRKQLLDSDNDNVPNIFDCQPYNTMRQDGFLGFGKKKETEFFELESPEYVESVIQQEENFDTYGEKKRLKGKDVGNVMIAADVVIPSGKLLTGAGLLTKKYVENIDLIQTDEHDKPYKIPRVQYQPK